MLLFFVETIENIEQDLTVNDFYKLWWRVQVVQKVLIPFRLLHSGAEMCDDNFIADLQTLSVNIMIVMSSLDEIATRVLNKWFKKNGSLQVQAEVLLEKYKTSELKNIMLHEKKSRESVLVSGLIFNEYSASKELEKLSGISDADRDAYYVSKLSQIGSDSKCIVFHITFLLEAVLHSSNRENYLPLLNLVFQLAVKVDAFIQQHHQAVSIYQAKEYQSAEKLFFELHRQAGGENSIVWYNWARAMMQQEKYEALLSSFDRLSDAIKDKNLYYIINHGTRAKKYIKEGSLSSALGEIEITLAHLSRTDKKDQMAHYQQLTVECQRQIEDVKAKAAGIING